MFLYLKNFSGNSHLSKVPGKTRSKLQLKNCQTVALAGWLNWLERGPIHQKVAGSIPGRGALGRQLIDVSLPLSKNQWKLVLQ